MNKHGFKHVRKVNDGRPKPYFGRVWFEGEPRQVGGGHATAREAHDAAVEFKREKKSAVLDTSQLGKSQ
jgi:hypothetical protein